MWLQLRQLQLHQFVFVVRADTPVFWGQVQCSTRLHPLQAPPAPADSCGWPQGKATATGSGRGTAGPARKRQAGALKVPAKLAFHLYKDKQLRKKLEEVHLPVHGKRKVSNRAELPAVMPCYRAGLAHVHCKLEVSH